MGNRGKKVFISHCENNFGPTEYAIRIIDYIGCIPVIAEEQPKLAKPVRSLVIGSMDLCDAAIIIATPDRDGTNGKEPSQSVSVEIGRIQEKEKFKEKYVIIKEESVYLGPMIPETHYKFSGTDYAPIAEAILIELKSMGLFRNYYELPGSDLDLHTLMETVDELKDLRNKGTFSQEDFKKHTEKAITDIMAKLTKEENKWIQTYTEFNI